METKLIKLETEFTTSGEQFKQLERTETKALYERILASGVKCYEWFRIKTAPSLRVIDGMFIKDKDRPKEYYPCDNDFGKIAWTSRTYEFAKSCYDNIPG